MHRKTSLTGLHYGKGSDRGELGELLALQLVAGDHVVEGLELAVEVRRGHAALVPVPPSLHHLTICNYIQKIFR